MQSKIIAIITGVVLLAALVSLRLALRSSGPKYQPELHTSLGWELAQQTAVAVHDRGQVVAVVADVYEQSGFVLSDQWRAFVGELKNHAAITLAPPEVRQTGVHVPLGDILDRLPKATAIVFFVDPPNALDLDTAASRSALPKIVVVGNPDLPTGNYYGPYLTSHIITALIIPRSTSAPTQMALPKTSREWFDKYYQVYTPQNADALPD